MKRNFELWIEHQISVGESIIQIDWLDVDPAEVEYGTPGRIAEMLFNAGYRPADGQKVNGKYIRLPQETWVRMRK